MKSLAKQNPALQVIGMSRSAKARDEEIKKMQNVSFVKGNCLDAESFRGHLVGVDAIIHCVGTLIESKTNPDLSYDAMNRDSAINMAGELHDIAFKEGVTKNFVMISSEKAPPFLEKYLTSKLEAERYILSDECSNLKPTIIRPGFIYDFSHRWWSLPLKIGVDSAWMLNEKVYKHSPFSKQTDFLFPAKSTKLSTVAHFAIEGALGRNENKIITNEQMIKYESGAK
ncbi:UNKNOWN [Stylonychia lemnae]|uniref:NAD(P)-binding domain-containing protein n=1 Tax=Stylonychia lemnae TaxID=5949 RepID=A0A078B4F4_STYLE|nr:UNKNOWN [Stylonychia lemnae]|eukprot:CDW89390.1 UNKNOWN [Stylonychia lemnae]